MQYKVLIANLYLDCNYSHFKIEIFISAIILKNYEHKIYLGLQCILLTLGQIRKDTITKKISPKKMITKVNFVVVFFTRTAVKKIWM